MDATNILIRLAERVDNLRRLSNPVEAKGLLDWIAIGGLESLTPGVTTFLKAVAIHPEGSTFYVEPPSITPIEPGIGSILRSYASRITAINEALHSSSKWAKKVGEDEFYEDLGPYLAGRGVYPEEISDEKKIDASLKGFRSVNLTPDQKDIPDYYFLAALDNPTILRRFENAYDMLQMWTDKIMVDQDPNFAFFLGGAGYTTDLYRKADIATQQRLYKDYKKVSDYTSELPIFLWGLDFV